MNYISILGLLTLLGSAWTISLYRSDVKIRPIIWGISLQLIFALIILREDYMSFVGMSILGVLLIMYNHKNFDKKLGDNISLSFLIIGISLSVGYLLTLIPQLTYILIILSFIAILSRNFINFKYDNIINSIFIISIIAYLISTNLHGKVIFQNFSSKIAYFLSLSDYGAEFLFGNLSNGQYFFTSPNSSWPGFGFQFAFKVLPTIIFFGGFMSVLYYWGIMQKIIHAMSQFMRWSIGTSGAETLSCSANVFVGQTEAPLLIKPFLNQMTKSELFTIMVGGFATIAGGVLAGYIAMGVPAGHLIAASVMSAPAALVIGKIIFPEKEHSETAGNLKLPNIRVGSNAIEAASNGITDGLKLAANVGAMLIGFIALIAVIDVILNWIDSIIDGKLFSGIYIQYDSSGLSPITGEFSGYFPGSLRTFFGTILSPFAFLMGVPWEDAKQVGNLLGIKLSLNEFVAFGTLGDYINKGLIGEKAIIISTYALCGFANFSSIGIQIGGMSALAPERKSDLAKIGLKAMFGGAIASWLTATVAGIFI
jgi:CNT family concentrative nucleoside transporter